MDASQIVLNARVDSFLTKINSWKEETILLRKILLDSGLSEDLKWGKPCYSFQKTNLVIIQGFKSYLAILFFKGVLLKDPAGILQKTGENTFTGRQIRFNNVQEIVEREPILRAYLKEAIEVEKAGVKVRSLEQPDLILPIEFQTKLEAMPELKIAFEALSPGRKKEYKFYFSAPKQAKTREARVEKYLPLILKGRGLNDR